MKTLFLHYQHIVFSLLFFIAIEIIVFSPLPSLALNIEEKLENAEYEQYAQDIFGEIRCMVCSGESIADSRVDLAKNLRALIREKIKNGYTKQQIIDYIELSYGQSILMKPPLKTSTYLLWFGPVFILILGLVLVIYMFRKKSNPTSKKD